MVIDDDDKICKSCKEIITDSKRSTYCCDKCMETEYKKHGKSLRLYHKYVEERIRNQTWNAMSDNEQQNEMMKFAKDYMDGKI